MAEICGVVILALLWFVVWVLETIEEVRRYGEE